MSCLACNKETNRKSYKYCSNKCQQTYQHQEYIKKWKHGLVSGNRGIVAKNISGHIKRYLAELYGEECSLCGWSKKNLKTGKVPLEIDHIDGNADNNIEENLRLICPNCHSLSSNFRNLNKGKGRSWRIKYLKSKSGKIRAR
jgi:Zn finger protein HypA/HybF involved in hydrogenase expression